MGIDLNNNPSGTWVKQDGSSVIIGSTLRYKGMLSNLFFTIIWTPSMLVTIGGLLSGEIGGFFISIFGLAFFLPGLWLWKNTIMAFWGKVEVSLNHDSGIVYSGIGKLGRSKAFKYKDIHTIEKYVFVLENDVPKYAIRLVNYEDEAIRFGGYMEEARRDFMIATIQAFMVDGDKVRDTLELDFIKHLVE